MLGGLPLILFIVCSHVGHDSGYVATKVDKNISEGESAEGRNYIPGVPNITEEGTWATDHALGTNVDYSTVKQDTANTAKIKKTLGRDPTHLESESLAPLEGISQTYAATEASAEGVEVVHLDIASKARTSSSPPSKETSNGRTSIEKLQAEVVSSDRMTNSRNSKIQKSGEEARSVLHNEVYSIGERQTMMSQLVGQKYIPHTDTAWSRPENKAELVENLRTMKQPSKLLLTKDEFIGRLEKLEGLDEGYLSSSRTPNNVNKQGEQSNMKMETVAGVYKDRSAARLAEQTASTTEPLSKEVANPVKQEEETGLKSKEKANDKIEGASMQDKVLLSPSLSPLSETSKENKEESSVKNDKAVDVTKTTTNIDVVHKTLPVTESPTKADELKKVALLATKLEEETENWVEAKSKQKDDLNAKSSMSPEQAKKDESSTGVEDVKAGPSPTKPPTVKELPQSSQTLQPTKPKILLEAIRFEIETVVDVTRGANGGILSRMIKIMVKLRDRLPDNTHMVKLNVIPYQMKHACYSAMVSAAKIEKDNNLTVFGDLEYRVTLEPLDASGNQLAKPSGIYLEAGSTSGDEKFDHTLFFRTVNLHGLDRTWLHKTFAVLGKIEPNKLDLMIWPEAGGYKAELTVRGRRSSMNLEKIRSSLGDRPDVLSKLRIDEPDWEVFLEYMREASDVSVYMKRESPVASVANDYSISETPPQKWGAIIFLLCLCFVSIRTIKKHFKIRSPRDIITLAESAASGRYNPISSDDQDDKLGADSPTDVEEFLAEVLHDLKVPQFEHKKYFNSMSDLHLWSVKQLQTMDPNDWLKLDIPSTVKDEMRIRLLQMKEKSSKKNPRLSRKKKTRKLLNLKDPTKRTDRGIEIVDASSDDNWG